jgi:hypothetical protein
LISEAPALSTTAEASHPQLQHIKKETSKKQDSEEKNPVKEERMTDRQ